MVERGKVVRVDDKNATVRIDRKSSCENCNMCGFKKKEPYIDLVLENTVNTKVNDIVEVEMTTANVMVASMIVYILPLFVGGLGMLLGILLKFNEVVSFALLVIGVLIGALIVYFIDKKLKKTKFNIVIKKIVE